MAKGKPLKSSERFDHGEPNEQVCDLLHTGGKFPDWVITTAFYSALHFVSYKIFPLIYELTPTSGEKKVLTFETLNDFSRFKGYDPQAKHKLLNDLVSEKCSDVYPEYDSLLGLSMTARYRHFQSDKLIVDKAVRDMKKIKEHCKPKK